MHFGSTFFSKIQLFHPRIELYHSPLSLPKTTSGMKTSFQIFLLLVFLFTSSAFLQAQNFEGVITYKYKYKDKTKFLKPKEVKKLHGTQKKFYFKGAKYKSELNGESKITQIHLNDTLYTANKTVRAVMWVSAAKPMGEVLSHNITRKATTINGISCDLLKAQTSNGTIEYYFNSAYTINHQQYANHHYQHWAFCLEMTNGALPIKFVFNTQKSCTEITCTNIQTLNVDDSVFDLPRRFGIIKMPERGLR